MADPIGTLLVRIGADANQLVAELGRSDRALGKTQGQFEIAAKAAKLYAAAALGVGGALAVMVKRAIDGADATSKMAQGAGLATSAFSELAYAARISGVEVQRLNPALRLLSKNMADTQAGTGEARMAFDALGISVSDAEGRLKSSEEMLAEVADKFAAMEDGAGKTALAMRIFGESGAALIPMLNQGAAGMAKLRAEAVALGVSIDTETGKAAEDFNDNLFRLGQVQQGLANQLMAELLPSLGAVTDQLVAAASASGDMRGDIEALARIIEGTALTVFQTLAVVGSDVAFVFKMIGGELGVWAAQLAALARGDFKGFKLIGEEWTKDAEQARRDLDAFQARIMGLGDTLKQAQSGLDDFWDFGGVKKGAAPRMEKPGRGGADTFDLGKQLQEGLDEELRIQMEAWEAVVEFRNKQLEDEQAHQDALAEIRYQEVLNEEALQQEINELIVRYRDEQLEKEKQAQQKRSEGLKRFMGNLGSLTNTESKKLFEIGKAAQIAMAAVEGTKSVMSAYRWGMEIGGPWTAAAFAAAAGLATANMINNIRAQQFGGTGTVARAPTQGSSGVTAGAGAAPASSSSRQTTIINLQGEGGIGRKQLRSLVEQINESMADGGRIVFSG